MGLEAQTIAMTKQEIEEVSEERRVLLTRCKAIVAGADVASREMTTKEREEYDVAMLRIRQIDSQMTALQPLLTAGRGCMITGGGSIESSNARFLTKEQRVADAPAFAGEAIDPFKQIRGFVTGNWEDADNEKRAMGENIGASGGFLLTPQSSGFVLDLARNATCVIQAGAQTVLMDSSEMVLATSENDPTAVWLAEGGTLSPTDIAFGKENLKAKVLAAMCRCSIQLATDAPNIDAVITNALTQSIALEFDRAALLGTGAAQPLGVYSTPLVNQYSLAVNGAVPANYDSFLYAAEYIRNANGNPKGVIMSPRTAGTLSRLKEGTTLAPLKPPDGYTALAQFVTNQIGNAMTWGSSSVASTAIVGDFSALAIGLAPTEGGNRSIRIDISRESEFPTLEILIRAYIRADIAVLRPTFFTRICGILA